MVTKFIVSLFREGQTAISPRLSVIECRACRGQYADIRERVFYTRRPAMHREGLTASLIWGG